MGGEDPAVERPDDPTAGAVLACEPELWDVGRGPHHVQLTGVVPWGVLQPIRVGPAKVVQIREQGGHLGILHLATTHGVVAVEAPQELLFEFLLQLRVGLVVPLPRLVLPGGNSDTVDDMPLFMGFPSMKDPSPNPSPNCTSMKPLYSQP